MRTTAQNHLRQTLLRRHPDLPPQLQIVNRFVLDQPEQAALMTIAEISARIGVQPSSLIRFSKAVGYRGFLEIQRILRAALSGQVASDYFTRLSATEGDELSDLQRFRRLAEASLATLPEETDLTTAAKHLAEARTIHVIGLGRSYGVAVSLTYLLSCFGAAVHLVAMSGGMMEASLSTITAKDALVAISFPDYAPQTSSGVKLAAARKARIVAITDSSVSPIAGPAEVLLRTDHSSDAGFRSGVGALITAQVLAAGYGRLAAG